MSRRKGELSTYDIDTRWPWQVAIAAAPLQRGDCYRAVQTLSEELGACPRGHYFRRDDQDFVVYCFAAQEQADAFCERFGGEQMTPAQRKVLSRRSKGAR